MKIPNFSRVFWSEKGPVKLATGIRRGHQKWRWHFIKIYFGTGKGRPQKLNLRDYKTDYWLRIFRYF